MKYLIALAVLLGLTISANAECLHDAAAVKAAHSGAWPSYHVVAGKQCWYGASRSDHRTPIAGVPVPRPKPVASGHTHTRTVHAAESPVPSPRIDVFGDAPASGPHAVDRINDVFAALGWGEK